MLDGEESDSPNVTPQGTHTSGSLEASKGTLLLYVHRVTCMKAGINLSPWAAPQQAREWQC